MNHIFNNFKLYDLNIFYTFNMEGRLKVSGYTGVRPVSPCLLSPFLSCPYIVLPVSNSLLVQLVPAVCLDYVPGASS